MSDAVNLDTVRTLVKSGIAGLWPHATVLALLEALAAEGREVAALRSQLAALLDRLTLTEEVLAECRAWHCSGHRRCELERGHAGDHFTTSLGNKFGGWDDSASVDVPRLLSAREAASRSHREMFERQAAAVRHHTDRAGVLARDLAAARAETSELRSALVNWGEHDRQCKRGLYPGIGACSCGLAAALAAPPQEVEA